MKESPRRKEWRLSRIAARKEAGLCIACGKVPVSIEATCNGCKLRHSEIQRKKDAKYLENGKCIVCGQHPPLEAMLSNKMYRLCEICHFKKMSRMNLGNNKHWEIIKQRLVEQQYRCVYTGTVLILGFNDSLDHIYPMSRYPELAKDPLNTQWVTREVNLMKHNRTPEEFEAILQQIFDYRKFR